MLAILLLNQNSEPFNWKNLKKLTKRTLFFCFIPYILFYCTLLESCSQFYEQYCPQNWIRKEMFTIKLIIFFKKFCPWLRKKIFRFSILLWLGLNSITFQIQKPSSMTVTLQVFYKQHIFSSQNLNIILRDNHLSKRRNSHADKKRPKK